MRRVFLILVLTATVLLLPSPNHALACSCMTYDVRERLPEVEGAFVGRLVPSDEPAGGGFSSATPVRHRYHVERPLKGDLPPGIIEVWGSSSGASCGLETPIGERAGLLLDRDGNRWTSGLCNQADPDVLIRAAQPLPPPNGRPPPAVLVGTTHGPGRMVSLDGSGRIVAYGDGSGTATDIAFCPGGDRVAEAFVSSGAHSSHRPGIATRSAADLRVAWERFLAPEEQPGYTSVADVACTDRQAGEVLVLTVEETFAEEQLYRTAHIRAFSRSGETRLIWTGAATGGVFSADGQAAYVTGGADGRDLLHVRLREGGSPAVRSVVRLPVALDPISLAPGERHLAGATAPAWASPDPVPATKALVVDLLASPPTVVQTGLGGSPGSYTSVLWSDTDRVVFVPGGNHSGVRVFDAALTDVGSWSGWGSSSAAVVGGRLVGLAGPKVIEAPLTTGPPAEWADLESGVPGAIAAVPDGAPIGAPAEPPPTTTTTTSEHGSPGELAVASLPGAGGGVTGGRPLLAGGAGAALLGVMAAGLVRRRRLPGPPQL